MMKGAGLFVPYLVLLPFLKKRRKVTTFFPYMQENRVFLPKLTSVRYQRILSTPKTNLVFPAYPDACIPIYRDLVFGNELMNNLTKIIC